MGTLLTNMLSTIWSTAEFVESITYHADGTDYAIDAVIDNEDSNLQDPSVAGDSMMIEARYSDLPINPVQGHTCTINSETWHVIGKPSGGQFQGTWQITVSRSYHQGIV